MTTKAKSLFSGRNLMFVVLLMLVSSVLTIWAASSGEGKRHAESLESAIVAGEVRNIIIVRTPDGLSVKLLELDNGKKYRLPLDAAPGIGKGFNVELKVPIEFAPIADEVSAIHPNAIPVISAKITAIPVPNSSRKLTYPPKTPPELIEDK